MENWKHIGALLTGIAALITACIPLFSMLTESQPKAPTTLHQSPNSLIQYAIVNDPDGWVNLRTNPTTTSQPIIKLINGSKVQILEQIKNWYKVKTNINEIGYIYSDRLKLQ